ncbi:MAG: TonB-dependent receptor [Novosphingobium sp.]|nr:TonB-dependent receptor [Novosphingobium sp.]
MSRNIKILLCAGASFAAVTANSAYAQDADRPEVAATDNSGDIIVSARRREERLQDVPISITVFNQAQLESHNIVSAVDLAQYTPSLSVNSRYGSENTSFAIRGFIQEGATAPSVATYFAEVVSPRVAGGTVAGNTLPPGSLFDLQNVQVLKGPQGTLFGRNTTGGAVLVVPQKPTDQFGGYLEGTVGDYNLVRLQGAINIPLSDTVRLRLSGDRETRKGYLNNVNGVGPEDFGDVNYYGIRGSLVIDLTPDLENYTVATYNHSHTHGSGIPKPFSYGYTGIGALLAPEIKAQIAATPGFYDVSNNVANSLEQIEQWQVINNTTWKASDTITLKNIISYAQFRERQSASIYGDNGYFFPGTFSPANLNFYTTDVIALPGAYNAAESTFTEEFQIQGRSADDRLNYQAGVYYEQSNPLNGYQQSYSPSFIFCSDPLALKCTNALGFGSISNSRSQYRFRDKALFAQATYKITNQLSLTGGFRYTWDDSRGLGDAIKITFPTPNVPSYGCSQPPGVVTGGTSAQIVADSSLCSYTREQKSSAPTWLIDLDYKPVDNVMVYA